MDNLKTPVSLLKMLLLLMVIAALHCSKNKTDPCLAEWGCSDCNCLFDKLQRNLHDPLKAQQIQECYDRVCK